MEKPVNVFPRRRDRLEKVFTFMDLLIKLKSTIAFASKTVSSTFHYSTSPIISILNWIISYGTIKDHTESYKTMHHTGSYRTMRDHTGLYRTYQDHNEPNGSLLDLTGPYRTLWDLTRPYLTLQDLMGPYVSLFVQVIAI